MQEIISAFGIDWRLIVIQVFNFSILAAALWYFLYTPVLRMISDREDMLKKGVLDAEKATRALMDADIEKTDILKEAHTEASLIVARGSKHAEEKGAAIEQEVAEKIAKQLESAKQQAEELKAKALKESESEIARVTLLGVENILNNKLGK